MNFDLITYKEYLQTTIKVASINLKHNLAMSYFSDSENIAQKRFIQLIKTNACPTLSLVGFSDEFTPWDAKCHSGITGAKIALLAEIKVRNYNVQQIVNWGGQLLKFPKLMGILNTKKEVYGDVPIHIFLFSLCKDGTIIYKLSENTEDYVWFNQTERINNDPADLRTHEVAMTHLNNPYQIIYTNEKQTFNTKKSQ